MIKHVLQWHITHKCNLRCLHCYQEDYKNDLSYYEIEKVFFDYLNYLKENNYKGHINITGGEPFLHPDFFKIIKLFEDNNITFGILTNGTLLNDDIVKKLSCFNNLSFVQISLDGTKKIHNAIRGEGNFQKSIKAIKILNKYNIDSMVAFTAHKKNYKNLKSLINLSIRKKVKIFWADRLIPTGTYDNILSTEEFINMAKLMEKKSLRAKRKRNCVTEIRVNRALMFLGGSNNIYHCSAGITLLTILANGDLLPCRRLPIVLGNTLEKTISDIYNESKIIKYIKNNNIPKECERCYKSGKCKGGLKCLTYALTGDILEKDVNCNIRTM